MMLYQWLLRCYDWIVQFRHAVLLTDVGTVDAAGSREGSVGKVGSGDAYVYADDAPVMMTDPSGRATSFWACASAGALAFFGALGITGGSGNLATALTATAKAVPDLISALASIGINVAEKFVPVVGWIVLGAQLTFGLAAAGVAMHAIGCF